MRKRVLLVAVILGFVVAGRMVKEFRRGIGAPPSNSPPPIQAPSEVTEGTSPKNPPNGTVNDRVDQYGAEARARMAPFFVRAGVSYPPDQLVFVAFKQEQNLQVYAADGEEPLRLVREYPILGASGGLGPKLKQGDEQVPEGIYRIESLNPNSRFHLSLRVNYPNEFDRARAEEDGRTQLGGDIMIHGGRASIGCLAMGDAVAEELFILAAQTGYSKIRMLISPVDFRRAKLPDVQGPLWLPSLYQTLEEEILSLPVP